MIFRSHWDYRNMRYEVMPHNHLVHTWYARTVRFVPEALSPAQADLRWPRLLPGSWPGIPSDSFSVPFCIMGDKAGRRRISLWDAVVWDSGMLQIHCVLEIQNISYLDKVTGVTTTVKKKKSNLYFHKCIKRRSLNTNEDVFADCDCSIIYVAQKGIINNLGTDAPRAKLCIFIIRLTKYQFTRKLTLHNRMCSHSLAGVMLKFIIRSNTKWVSYSHQHSIYCLPCSTSLIFL